jgi:Cu-Zn family superoxide dismutase
VNKDVVCGVIFERAPLRVPFLVEKGPGLMRSLRVMGALVVFASSAAQAATLTIPMYRISDSGVGAPLGYIRAEDAGGQLKLTPDLAGLPPGAHGFHLHENGSCEPAEKDGKAQAGMAAGGHWDPKHTGKHLGPGGEGHQGDLPALMVDPDGTAKTPVLAPKLSVADLKGRALVLHAGGDNYSDSPEALGGGGSRIACGVAE